MEKASAGLLAVINDSPGTSPKDTAIRKETEVNESLMYSHCKGKKQANEKAKSRGIDCEGACRQTVMSGASSPKLYVRSYGLAEVAAA